MLKFKKVITFVFALFLLISLASCGYNVHQDWSECAQKNGQTLNMDENLFNVITVDTLKENVKKAMDEKGNYSYVLGSTLNNKGITAINSIQDVIDYHEVEDFTIDYVNSSEIVDYSSADRNELLKTLKIKGLTVPGVDVYVGGAYFVVVVIENGNVVIDTSNERDYDTESTSLLRRFFLNNESKDLEYQMLALYLLGL